VTVVVTACGRPDLLGRTLRSLFAALDQPVAAVIVVEDSGTPGVNATLQAQYPFIRYINNMRNFGQQASIDAAYAQVRTPYVLHCEGEARVCACACAHTRVRHSLHSHAPLRCR